MSDIIQKPATDLISEMVAASNRNRPLDLSKLDTSGLPLNFKPTTAFREVIEAIEYARERRKKLALVTGSHGVGKSTSLTYYAQKRAAVFWECPPGYQPKHVLADIAKYLGISTGTGWRMQTSIVIDQLRADPRIMILDEAQRLNYDGFDLLKYIADQSRCTFIFSSSPSLAKRIERWPDIASRCGVRVDVKPMTLDEFIELYQGEKFALAALEEMHRLTGGVMRVLQDLIEQIDIDIAVWNGLEGKQQVSRGDLLALNVRESAEKVVG